MQKKTVAIKVPSRYSDEDKRMLHRFAFNVNNIASGKYVTRIMMQCLWQAFAHISKIDCWVGDAIGDVLFDMNCCAGRNDLNGCVNAAKRIKEVLRDCDMWNID